MNIKNGNIDINGIEIFNDDDLTAFLVKTVYIKKLIHNVNNFQIVYIENSLICGLFTTCKLVFSNIGQLKEICMGFSMDDERNYNRKIYEEFLEENDCSDSFSFCTGQILISLEPHFQEYSIEILYK